MTSRPSFTNQQINAIIVDKHRHDPRYVYAVTRLLQSELRTRAAGAATPILNKTSFENVEVPAPDLAVQRRIGSILSAYDDLIEVNRRRIVTLEKMARGLFEEWFVCLRFPGHEESGMLETPNGPFPKYWTKLRISDAFNFRSGATIGKSDRAGTLTPVYGANGIIGITDRPPNSRKCVVIGKIGSCGSYHRADEGGYVTNNAFAAESQTEDQFEFMAQVLKGMVWKPYIGGAANPYMPLKHFENHLITYPTRDLCTLFNERASSWSELALNLAKSNLTLAATRDLLLPHLVSGNLSVAAAECELEEAA